MTQAHYRLTAEEFLALNSKLTNAELRVYLYLKTIDPFGDRKVEIATSAISTALNIGLRTVQRAMNKLSDLKLIVWEKVKSLCQVFKKLTGDTSAAEMTPVTRQEDRPDDISAAETTPMSPERHPCRQQVVKPKPKAKSGTPQTIQTSSNYSNKDDFDFEQDEMSEEYMRFRSLESRWRLLPHDRHVIQYELEQNPDWAIAISADGKKLVRLK